MGCDPELRFVWIIEHPVNTRAAVWSGIPEKIRSGEGVVHSSYHRKYVTIMNLDSFP